MNKSPASGQQPAAAAGEYASAERYNPNAMKKDGLQTAMLAKTLTGKTALVTGGAKRLGRASALALARAGADVAVTFHRSRRAAQHTVIDLAALGVRAVALPCDVTQEKCVRNDHRGGERTGPDRHSGEQRGQLRDGRVRDDHSRAVGCDLCFEYARPVPGHTGGAQASAGAAGKGDQHGLAGRTRPLGVPCALLLVEGSPAHADQSDGQGFGSGDRGKCGRARND